MPLLNEERDQDVESRHSRGGGGGGGNGSDREITLGTMTILAIFFALAVLCAGFFGFGYTSGRHSVPGPQVASANPGASPFSFGTSKPSAASPVGADLPSAQPPAVTSPFQQQPPPQGKTSPVTLPAEAAPVTRFDPDAEVVGAPSSTASVPRFSPADTPADSAPSSSAGGPFMVQVAAFSHQEDADMTVSALKRAHYNVSIRSEPQDKLLHVQIGPFTSRKDADAMRQRVVADGFHAIVK